MEHRRFPVGNVVEIEYVYRKSQTSNLLNAATRQEARCSRFGWEKFEY
jgi:hypothetical protein